MAPDTPRGRTRTKGNIVRSEEFRSYLTSDYRSKSGRPLGAMAAHSLLSRCRRVERALALDLDRALDASANDPAPIVAQLDHSAGKFHSDGNEKDMLASLRHAVRLYATFRAAGDGGR
jgi:hypothetical protein